MPLSKSQKEQLVQTMVEKMQAAKSVIFADFQGLSVKDLTDLRRKMRAEGVEFKVCKRTLIKIAAKQAGFGEVPDEALEGPVGSAFSMEGEVAAAKIIKKFAKTNENLKLRGGLMEGRVLTVSETKALADLPSKEELIGKFVYLVKYPVQGFHGVLNNTVSGFVRVLNAVKEQKEQNA